MVIIYRQRNDAEDDDFAKGVVGETTSITLTTLLPPPPLRAFYKKVEVLSANAITAWQTTAAPCRHR